MSDELITTAEQPARTLMSAHALLNPRRRTHSKARKRARRLRHQIIESLGAMCACCRDSITQASLTIDHKRNDGAAHRREFSDIRELYRDILAQGCPPDRYEVLCQTCHNSRTARGECEHVTAARALFGLAA